MKRHDAYKYAQTYPIAKGFALLAFKDAMLSVLVETRFLLFDMMLIC